ncbi:hypothetical protein HHI36_019440, partial [Cryptolaemus montrouzieri]
MLRINGEYKLSQEMKEKCNRRLRGLCAKYGFECTQVNGQRICTSTIYPVRRELRGTEIFIGKIPRNVFEDELIPLFMKAGTLCRFRLMLDFSLKNRGYAFATYTKPEYADRAILLFDNYEIRPKYKMGIFKSIDNCRLFFGNIPLHFNKADILKVLTENSIGGINEIIMYEDLLNPKLNRGYVFVEFLSHRDAAMARKQLYPGCLIVNGEAIFVDWADPIPDVDPQVMAKVTKLFIHHLPIDLTRDELAKIIDRLVDRSTVARVHKQRDYAFVHFEDRIYAEKGLKALRELPFPGVVVEWARPREYSKQARSENPPTHFCLSLPPKMRRRQQQYINNFISDSSSSDSQKSVPTSPKAIQTNPRIGKKEDDTPTLPRAVQCKPGVLEKEMVSTDTSPRSIVNTQMSNAQALKNLQSQQLLSSLSRNNEFKSATDTPYDALSKLYQYHQNHMSPSTSVPNTTKMASAFREEQSYRDPLIGLSVPLLPIGSVIQQQRNTPSSRVLQERSLLNDILLPHSSCRNAFSLQTIYNNNSLSSNRE